MKYPSKYSNGKEVSGAQYITETICENKAKINKEDLHFRFWTMPKWSRFFRDQIATANKLIKQYGEKAVIRALHNPKAQKIYSLRAPHLIPIIEEEVIGLEKENKLLTKTFERKENVSHRRHINNQNSILSKLEEMDNGS